MARTFLQLKTVVATDNLGRDSTGDLTKAGDSINWVLTEHLPKVGLLPFKKNTDLTTVADQEYVDLPSDFESLTMARVLQSGGDYEIMSDSEWADFEVSDTGEPAFKMVMPSTTGWRLYLRLIPDDAYTINIWYDAKEATLSADETTPQLSTIYGDAPIISGATWRLALTLGLEKDEYKWGRIFNKVDLPELLAWQGKVKGYKSTNPTYSPYK